MFALAEGAAAIALVAVMTAAARAARRGGQARAGLGAAAFGIAVAAVSWAELALGTWLISGLVPDRRTATAGAVWHGRGARRPRGDVSRNCAERGNDDQLAAVLFRAAARSSSSTARASSRSAARTAAMRRAPAR